MRKMRFFPVAIVLATLLCLISFCGAERPARTARGEAAPQTEEVRKLMQELRELSAALREATVKARQDEKVRAAFQEVRKMQEALAKAEEDARAVADRAIVQASPDLAEQIKRRREIEQKLREIRGESARTRLAAAGAEPPAAAAPAEEPPTPKMEATGIGSIVHFEIPVDDMERARKFYGELFGWKIEKAPGPMEYWMITPKDEKAVRGGLMRREQPQQTITDYFIVPSVDEYVGKVQKLGGQVVVPKMPVPGMGYFAYCLDTEKNAFAIWETNPEAK